MRRWRDPNEAYLVLQTVVGAWPLTPARLELYIEKALREAKAHTSWIDPDHEWEAGAKAWAVDLLRDDELGGYAQGLSSRTAQIVLGMTLLKLTVPGVPDIYQGDELPFFALVDPDNRRPVNLDERRRLLGAASPPPKLDLIRRTLELRGRRPAAFAGGYEALETGEDVVAFTARRRRARRRRASGRPWPLPRAHGRMAQRPSQRAASLSRACLDRSGSDIDRPLSYGGERLAL